jgi:hypothetical protein
LIVSQGSGTVLPELRQPIARMLIAAGVIASGLMLCVAASRTPRAATAGSGY